MKKPKPFDLIDAHTFVDEPVRMVPPQYKKGGSHAMSESKIRKREAKTVTKVELNAAGCATPDCGHDHSTLYLHSACHTNSGSYVRYEKEIESLIITCARCDDEIIRIKL
jgi:hypothetical protein